MKLGILATGITPDDLQAQYGSYADMFMRLFDSVQGNFDYQVFEARLNQLPESPLDCDAWIITGSKHSVYEDLGWIHNLKAFIREIVQTEQPLVGICFGHQLIAEALGGKVEKYSGGWRLGIHQYQTQGSLQDYLKSQLKNQANQPGTHFQLNAVHQDQVVKLPSENGLTPEVIAQSEFCQYAGLSYKNGQIVSLQAHPEFTLTFETDLLQNRAGQGIPEQPALEAAKGTETEGASVDSPEIAKWLVGVLKGK
ncbi:MAG: type 1 glutamine amidotransferase [Oceanobacter sp.]